MADYLDLCQQIWTDWKNGKPCAVPSPLNSDFAPEPYLRFSVPLPNPNNRSLVFVTTNPGPPMPSHTHEAAKSSASPFASARYSDVSAAAGSHYLEELSGVARGRIESMCALAGALGFGEVLQVELFPWHSERLPNKTKIVESCKDHALITAYHQALREFLRDRNAILISAVRTATPEKECPITHAFKTSPWLQFAKDIMSWPGRLGKGYQINSKSERVTSRLFVPEGCGQNKAMFLMMGGNNLPSAKKRTAST